MRKDFVNIIGRFTRISDGSFLGEITTLAVQAKNVRITPEATSAGDDAPTHCVHVGEAHIGAGWELFGQPAAMRVCIDDPSFSAAIFGQLIEEPKGSFTLVWTREAPRSG